MAKQEDPKKKLPPPTTKIIPKLVEKIDEGFTFSHKDEQGNDVYKKESDTPKRDYPVIPKTIKAKPTGTPKKIVQPKPRDVPPTYKVEYQTMLKKKPEEPFIQKPQSLRTDMQEIFPSGLQKGYKSYMVPDLTGGGNYAKQKNVITDSTGMPVAYDFKENKYIQTGEPNIHSTMPVQNDTPTIQAPLKANELPTKFDVVPERLRTPSYNAPKVTTPTVDTSIYKGFNEVGIPNTTNSNIEFQKEQEKNLAIPKLNKGGVLSKIKGYYAGGDVEDDNYLTSNPNTNNGSFTPSGDKGNFYQNQNVNSGVVGMNDQYTAQNNMQAKKAIYENEKKANQKAKEDAVNKNAISSIGSSTSGSNNKTQALTNIGATAAGAGSSYIDVKNKDERGRYTNTGAAVGSNALKYAALGASAGSVVGPWGTLIGGAAGGIGGAIYGGVKGEKDKKSIKSSKEKQKNEIITANNEIKQQQAIAARNNQEENPTITNPYDENNAMFNSSDELIKMNKGGVVSKIKNMYADGGDIKGKGTAKSDSIMAEVKEGSFVVPAENAELAKGIRKLYLKAPNKKANLKQEEGEAVKLSNGEHLFTPEENEYLESIGIDLEDLAPNAENGEEEMAKGGLTASKARMILHDKKVHGKPLTDKQRKFFGAISNGASIKGYAAGGDVEGEPEIKTSKIEGRRNSTGNKDFDTQIDELSKKEYSKVKDVKSDIDKLQSLQEKYSSLYGKNSEEIALTIQKLHKTVPVVEKNESNYKRDSEINKNIELDKKELKEMGASDAQIKEYESKATTGNNKYFDKYRNEAKKKIAGELSYSDAGKSKALDEDLLKKDAKNFYAKRLIESINNVEIAKLKPQNFTREQIDNFNKDVELYKRKSLDVDDAIKNGGMKLVRERDVYRDLSKTKPSSSANTSDAIISETKNKSDVVTPETNLETAPKLKQSDKTYEELIKKPVSYVGTPEAWKKAVDDSIAKGDTIPKGGVPTTKPSLKAPKVTTSKVTVDNLPTKDLSLQGLKQDAELKVANQAAMQEASIANAPTRQAVINDANVTSNENYLAAKPKSKNAWADKLSNIDPTAFVGIGQSALGLNMLGKEKRPIDKAVIDPTYNAAVNRAQQDALFGLTPEQRFMAEQDIQGGLNDAKMAGLNASGVQSFNLNRAAINDAWRNKLGLKQADAEMRMNKQKYADVMAGDRASILAGNRRQAFKDSMDAFQQKQQAGSELIGAGLANTIGAYRFRQDQQARLKADEARGYSLNNYNPTT